MGKGQALPQKKIAEDERRTVGNTVGVDETENEKWRGLWVPCREVTKGAYSYKHVYVQ